jgi:hypothetical protein
MLGGIALAASPQLSAFNPAGIQRGADTDVTISGQRLQDARGLLVYTPGIQVLSMQPLDPGHLRARLRVLPDSPLGEHEVRVWTATGITEMLPLYVGPFPNVACSGSNHIVAHAQPVPLNCTVNGVIQNEEIDYYSVQAKKGDRITAEVEGMRLGRDMFDPWAAILDASGRQLAADDDNTLLLQDPLVSIIAPADGKYLVSVRESTWGGSSTSLYRLHIGNFPQPYVVYPSGGPVGKALPVTFLGDVKGPMAATIQLPPVPGLLFPATVSDNGLVNPAVLPMRVSPFPNVLAQSPDNDAAHATPGPPPPVAFNGIITRPRESDFFRFHATRGQALDITVYARQLRSPLDSVLDVWNAKGGHLASNDDSIGLDSYLRFNVPADGDYCVSVRDQLFRGGPNFVYRVEAVPVVPDISFTMPEIVKNSQERQTIVVPRGNRYATMLRMKRDSFDGPFQLNLPSLPPGVTLQTGSAAGDMIPVIFLAQPDAPVSATLTDVLARPADATQHPESGYAQTVELIHGPPNDYPYLVTNISRLALSVAEEAPFQIDLVPPVVPILEDGQGSLRVTAIRKPGFTGAINVSMLYNPPGVSSQAVVTIPAGQTSVDLPINASGDAKTKTWQIAVIGSADAGQGSVWTSSMLAPLTVSKPFFYGQIDRSNAVQGDPVAITCHLNQNLPFDGPATLRLMGLPTKVMAPDVIVTSSDTQALFNVTTDPTTPAGQHKDLFCQITVEKSGVKMVANTAFGGVLRIDPAAKKEVAAK